MTNEGKIHLIGLKDTPHNYALTHLQHDVFHGLRCLKGVARTTHAGHWIEGKRVYVPFEQIAAITEFDSWADYLAVSKRMDNPSAKVPAPAGKPKPQAKPKRRR